MGQTASPLKVTTTAVPFLRISPDARAGGMGDLGVATSPDPASSFYNQAKIPFAKKDLGLSLTYTPWLKDLGLNDVYLLAFSGYKKLDDQSALSMGIRYFSLGNIQFTDFNGNQLGSGHPREFAFDLGYSRKLADKLSIALAGRYIYSNLASGYAASGSTYQPGKTFAADVSLYYHGVTDAAGGWNFGLALTNLGGKIGYTNSATEKDFIPADLGLGASYTAVFNEDNKLMIGLDIHKLLVPVPPSPSGNDSVDNVNLTAYHNKSLTGSWFSSFSGENQFKTLQIADGPQPRDLMQPIEDLHAVRGDLEPEGLETQYRVDRDPDHAVFFDPDHAIELIVLPVAPLIMDMHMPRKRLKVDVVIAQPHQRLPDHLHRVRMHIPRRGSRRRSPGRIPGRVLADIRRRYGLAYLFGATTACY